MVIVINSVTRECCQWGKWRFKLIHATGSQKFPGIRGIRHHWKWVSQVEAVYEKVGCKSVQEALESPEAPFHSANWLTSPLPKPEMTCWTLWRGCIRWTQGSCPLDTAGLWAATWTARDVLKVCTLNGNNFIQLTPLSFEKLSSQIYVVKARHLEFLLGKLTSPRRQTYGYWELSVPRIWCSPVILKWKMPVDKPWLCTHFLWLYGEFQTQKVGQNKQSKEFRDKK